MPVVVVGSLNMDVVVRTSRYPARGENVPAESIEMHPGGKGANQAVAAARLGAAVRLIGCVGDDETGTSLVSFIADDGVDVSGVRRVDGVPTGTAVVVVDDAGENTIMVVLGANGSVLPADAAGAPVEPGDFLVCQLEMPHETAEASLRHARSMAATSVLNAAPIRPWMTDLAALADIVVVNELERDALGSSPRAAGQVLIETLGRRGARATTDEGVIEVPGLDVPVVDTTGAGDCFVGALAARLDAGDPLLEALHYANRAAAVSVGRTGAGTSLPTANEVSAGQ